MYQRIGQQHCSSLITTQQFSQIPRFSSKVANQSDSTYEYERHRSIRPMPMNSQKSVSMQNRTRTQQFALKLQHSHSWTSCMESILTPRIALQMLNRVNQPSSRLRLPIQETLQTPSSSGTLKPWKVGKSGYSHSHGMLTSLSACNSIHNRQ